jgi:hypothetical protein
MLLLFTVIALALVVLTVAFVCLFFLNRSVDPPKSDLKKGFGAE